jgi:hypothetical protein
MTVTVPNDLELRVRQKLTEHPERSWHEAVRLLARADNQGSE